jgi:hypothetical protein
MAACDGAVFVAEDVVVKRYNNRDFTQAEGTRFLDYHPLQW